MEPISIAMGAIGLGMQIFGGMGQSKIAGEQAQVSMDEAKQEQGINDAKQQAMVLQANRMQIENARNIQRSRAYATNAAVGQGAQFGSGLQGGLGQVTDQGLFNGVGVNQAVQTGKQINQFNQNISWDKMQTAQLGGQFATDQGISSLGGAVMKAGPTVGALTQNFTQGNKGGMFFNGPWSIG